MSSIFQGATINTDHTLRDWGCAITNSDIISVPEPNLTVLEIPGRNGRLDLSEALTGDITYGNRTIKLELAVSVNISTWFNKCDYIFRNYHGKIVTVTFDDDLTHYYRGRAAVSDPQRVRNGGTLTFTVDAEPFRYKKTQTVIAMLGSTTKNITNMGRMPVCPMIRATADCELVVGDITYDISTGDQTIPSFFLPSGTTSVRTTGLPSGQYLYFFFTEGYL